MGAEALFQAEGVMFEMKVPPESMESDCVPRYQLVIKLHTGVGTIIAGHQSQRRKSVSFNTSPPLAASIYTLSLLHACLN